MDDRPKYRNAPDEATAKRKFVYVEEDGSVRDVSDDEAEYLATAFEPTDGNMPYVKPSYTSRTPTGSIRGFLPRSEVPWRLPSVRRATMDVFDRFNASYASRANRLLGQVLDGAIGGAPFVLARFLLVGVLPREVGFAFFVLAGAWAVFYYLLADGLHGGQSLAKQWLGMQVVSEKSGRPCTFGQSFVRNLLLAVLGPLDWIFIFGEKHQRLGDKAAGTVVLED